MFEWNEPAAATDRYTGGEYRQHHPHRGDGKEVFIEYLERMAAKYPGKRVGFERVLALSR